MARIHKIFDALIGLRKLLFSIVGIFLIVGGMMVYSLLFIVNYALHVKDMGFLTIGGDDLASVYSSGFTYIAAVAGAYLAINVANKWVGKWISKRK